MNRTSLLFFVIVVFATASGFSAVPSASPVPSPQRVAKRDNVTYSAYKKWYRSTEKVDVPAEPVGGIAAFIAHLDYPRDLRRRRLEGKVRIEVTVGPTGAVKSARIVQSGGPLFDPIVLRAVRDVRWTPAMKSGKRVPFTFTFPVSFISHA